MNKTIKTIFFVLTAFVFIIIAKDLDIKSVKDILGGFRWRYAFYFAFCYFATYIFYTKKIVYLFKNISSLKFSSIYHILFAGSYINFIFAGVGEIFKIFYLKQEYKISMIKSAIILLFDRLFTFLILLVVIIFSVITSGIELRNGPEINRILEYRTYITFFVLSVIGSFSILYLVSIKKDYVIKLIYKILPKIPVIKIGTGKVEDIFSLSDIIFKPVFLLNLSVIVILQLIFEGLRHYTLYRGIDYNISPLLCTGGYIFISLITNIPGLPAKIGAFEAVYLSVFHFILNVPLNVCVPMIVLDRLFSTTLLFVSGLISFNFLHIRWSYILKLKRDISNK